MKFPRKIPTILGILMIGFLVFIVGLGSHIIFRDDSTRASKSSEPRDIQITNVTDTSFSVSWFTPDLSTGAILVSGNGIKKQTYFDDRDKQTEMNSYLTHTITVRALQQNTTYKFTILSGSKQFQDNGKEFSTVTAGTLPTPNGNVGPAYGSIRTSEDKPATGAIVSLSFSGSQTLSTTVTESGSWIIPIYLIRNTDLSEYSNFDKSTVLYITVKHPDGDASIITTVGADSPVPVVTLGKSYDFRLNAQVPTPTLAVIAKDNSQNTKSVLGAMTEETASPSSIIAINQPSDNASLVSNQPLFSGTGIPSKKLTITLSTANPKTNSITISADGTWKFTPLKPLAAGKQSITISTVDKNGKQVIITRSFEIMKSGTQVLGDATPSASIAPTTAITATPTRVATHSATLAPTPTTASSSGLPASGNWNITLIMLTVGAIFIFGGLIVAL